MSKEHQRSFLKSIGENLAKNRDDRRPFDLVIEWGSATLRNSQCMYWGEKGRRLEGDE